MNILHNTKDFFLKYKALIILSFFLSALLFALPACKDSGNEIITPSPSGDNVSVGFFSEGQGDNNSIVITEAKFLMRKMTLELEEGENECDIKLGPFIVYLDFTQKVVIAAINKIPPGNYDAVKFKVHKPGPNENIGDPDFTESTSRRFSVVVKGFYNDVPFVYKSDVTVSKKIELENHAVTIAASQLVNITISLNPYSWFTENGVILDPTNTNNSNTIDHNIKQSLRRAFRDINQDGDPD
jgi:hypothetical protein